MSLAIVVPTIGRLSLAFTLTSFAHDLLAEDEVIVIADGSEHCETVRRLVEHMDATSQGTFVFECLDVGQGCWGQPARNHGFDLAWATHWATIDDDDIYLPGALTAMRAAIERDASIPTVFRCQWGPGHFAHGTVLWREQEIRLGSIATPMLVAPASECRFGLDYAGDHAYALALQQKFGAFQWDEQVIAEVRPAISSEDVAR